MLILIKHALKYKHILWSMIFVGSLVNSDKVEAQTGAEHWLFGNRAYIHFSDTGIVVDSSSMVSYEAGNSLSDSNGNLLFYGNSEKFYTVSDSLFFQNKYGSASSTQGMNMLRFGNDTTVHFFTEQGINFKYSSGLYYGRFGMNSLEVADTVLILKPSTEKSNSIDHQNRRYIWFANREANSNLIYFFLLMDTGLICCPVIDTCLYDYEKRNKNHCGAGRLKFSPNGQFLVISEFCQFLWELGAFDNEYADFKNIQYLTLSNNPYSAEFSSNSKYVYIGSSVIYGYPLDSFYEKTPMDWQYFEVTPNNKQSRTCTQLGPDGNIYVNHREKGFLDVIENPDDPNKIIYKEAEIVLLEGTNCLQGLPSFHSSYFHHPSVDFSYTENCRTNHYTFKAKDTFNATSYLWNITHLATGKKYKVNGKEISFTFPFDDSLRNMYRVELVATSFSKTDSASKEITIRPKLKPGYLGRDTFYCENDSFVLRAPKDMHCVHWMGEEPNLDIQHGPVIGYQHFQADSLLVDITGWYFSKVTNKAFCQVRDTIFISEAPKPGSTKIYSVEDMLLSQTSAYRYKWFLNGHNVSITDSSGYKPILNGYYQLQLVSEKGCTGPVSDSFLVDNLSLKGITEIDCQIFPNPTKNKSVNIVLPTKDSYEITFYDLQGRLLKTQIPIVPESLIYELNLNDLRAQNYLIVIKDSFSSRYTRIITVRE